MRDLYEPVRAAAARSAPWGFLAVGALKALHTTVLLGQVSPSTAVAFVLIALLGLPKANKCILPASIALFVGGSSSGLSFFSISWSMILGAWFGVMVFARCLRHTWRVIWGTVTGMAKDKRGAVAPDAEPEGARPLVLGLLLPMLWLTGVVLVYIQVLTPS